MEGVCAIAPSRDVAVQVTQRGAENAGAGWGAAVAVYRMRRAGCGFRRDRGAALIALPDLTPDEHAELVRAVRAGKSVASTPTAR